MNDAVRNALVLLTVVTAGIAAAIALDGLDLTRALVALVLLLWRVIPRTRP